MYRKYKSNVSILLFSALGALKNHNELYVNKM